MNSVVWATQARLSPLAVVSPSEPSLETLELGGMIAIVPL